MKGSRRVVAFLAVAIAASACATMRANGDLQTLGGAEWRLVDLGGRPAIPTEVKKRPSLRFDTDSNRVSGSAGCNRVSGPFTVSGEAMHFGALISTKMACVDQALNQQETDFLGALQSTDRYAVRGDTLVLLRGSDVLARFRP